jgi:hypothetical protein
MLTQTYSHALTLWQNAVAQFQQNNITPSASQEKSKAPSVDFQHTTYSEPIVQLWLLRLLVPLECHRKFIGKINSPFAISEAEIIN